MSRLVILLLAAVTAVIAEVRINPRILGAINLFYSNECSAHAVHNGLLARWDVLIVIGFITT